MKESENFIKYLKKWIRTNNYKYDYKAFLIRDIKNRNNWILKFASNKNIYGFVKNDGTCDIWIEIYFNKKFYYENLYDASSFIEKDKKGFYCKLCTKRTYHKNKNTIWSEHLRGLNFWILENLKLDKKFKLKIYDDEKSSSYDIKAISKKL